MLQRLVSLALLAAVGCSSSSEEAASPAPPTPGPTEPAPLEPGTSIETTACRFPVAPSLEGKDYVCFDLSVPENRTVEGSRKIKIHAIRFVGKPGGTPTIELNGGPGGPSDDLAMGLSLGMPHMTEAFGRLREIGDYILVDQRGTGRSIPRLSCPDDEYFGGLTGMQKCAKRHADQGVDFTGYATSENADDIHALKVALGLPAVNLHGISYGSRLALEIMRRHPGDVRAAIIDGVVPAQGKLVSEGSTNLNAGLTHIFAACAADAQCHQAFPDLEGVFAEVVNQLNTKPFKSQGYDFDGYAFVYELTSQLSQDGFAALVPLQIYDMLNKTQAEFDSDTKAIEAEFEASATAFRDELQKSEVGKEVLARLDADKDTPDMAMAMNQTVVCADFVQYESVEEALSLDAKVRPGVEEGLNLQDSFDFCKSWTKRAKANDVWVAVSSSLPTLAVAGAYDATTPPRWRDLAAETLSVHSKVTMGAGGHGAVDPCGMNIKVAFLNDPAAAVDGSCADAQKVQFVLSKPGKRIIRRSPVQSLVTRPHPRGAKARLH